MFMLTCTQKKSADLSVTSIKKGCFVVPKNGLFGELNFYNKVDVQLGSSTINYLYIKLHINVENQNI